MGKYGNKPDLKPPPVVITNSEKAQIMAREQTESIASQIEEGKMQVSPRRNKIKSPPKTDGEETLESI